MKLTDLRKRISDMTDEELHTHVHTIRHNREVARLGKAARENRSAKRESRHAAADINLRLDKLSADERQSLLELLEGLDDDNG